MDWRTIGFDWNRARAFLVTAEAGSLSAAARALGTTQPTLGRQVAALEEELGVALFERGARGLDLTPGGLALVEHVRLMGEAASRLSLAAGGRAESVEGTITISASDVTAAYLLPPLVERLRRLQPGIEVEVVATDRASDLRRREADIAIRAFRPTQGDLIARRLRALQAGLYAAPTYLERIGRPDSAGALAGCAEFIGFEDNHEYVAALRGMGIDAGPGHFPVRTGNHLVHWALVCQGVGIGIMPVDIGDAERRVERVLGDELVWSGDLWLVAHRELRTSRRVRTVFDFLAEALG